MADDVGERLAAELNRTGVGGPDAEEDQPAGTVWVGVYVDGRLSTHRLGISGDPAEVCQGAVERALDLVVDALRR